jgi:hypothetical protein
MGCNELLYPLGCPLYYNNVGKVQLISNVTETTCTSSNYICYNINVYFDICTLELTGFNSITNAQLTASKYEINNSYTVYRSKNTQNICISDTNIINNIYPTNGITFIILFSILFLCYLIFYIIIIYILLTIGK